MNRIDCALSIVARWVIDQTDNAVCSAWLVSSEEQMIRCIVNQLLGHEAAGLNEADAGALNVIEVADAGCMRRNIRIVHFRINAAETVAGITVPQVANRIAGRSRDLARELTQRIRVSAGRAVGELARRRSSQDHA